MKENRNCADIEIGLVEAKQEGNMPTLAPPKETKVNDSVIDKILSIFFATISGKQTEEKTTQEK